eukprot:4390538-Amphidinium_carterae.3
MKARAQRDDGSAAGERLTKRRGNGGHCSYFHRWMNHPIWGLGQAKMGNGPYTLLKERFEPANAVWQVVNFSSLPDDPSRKAYVKYRQLA